MVEMEGGLRMNPLLASPRLDSELVFLEGLLNDDCKCESSHAGGTNIRTRIAVARKRGCTLEFNICRSSYEWNTQVIEERATLCDGCGMNVANCWTIRPI